MKKLILLWLYIWIFFPGLIFTQGDKSLKENISVINVEVPVRVYHKGEAVNNLTKNDFRIYESGKLQTINGFIIKRKKIKLQNIEMNVGQKFGHKSRYFVLVFHLTQYNDHVRDGLDTIFKKLLNESDELLVFINNKSKYYNNLNDKEAAKKDLNQLLRTESHEARNTLLMYVRSIETLIYKLKFERNLQNPVSYHWIIEEFFRKFLNVWKDYKKRYLIPDINKYYNFSKFLEKIEKEKWVFSFYQKDVFPDIIRNNENMNHIETLVANWEIGAQAEVVSVARMIRRHIMEISKEMSLAKDFPSDEVARLFHNADATFHTIFMKSTFSSFHQNMRYREVGSDLENSLRSITKLTGGKLIVSNRIDKSLEEISETEDIYYILTYEPKNPDKVGKIKVKLKNRKYKLVYSPNLRFGFLSEFLEKKRIVSEPLKIQKVIFKKGKLMFTLTDIFINKKNEGSLSIRIRIKNKFDQSIFDQKKLIRATQKKSDMSLNFSTLNKGVYDLIIDVTDLYTNVSVTEALRIEI